MKACCFTGYRPDKMPFPLSRDNEDYIAFSERLFSAIENAAKDGYDTFYSGGALGFDIIAAELVLSLREKYGLTLIIAAPYKNQAANFPPSWRSRYDWVLMQANSVVYVSENYSRECFQKRNEYMVDRSERVITYFDGKRGGTANTVRYAHRKERQVVNVAIDETQLYLDI